MNFRVLVPSIIWSTILVVKVSPQLTENNIDKSTDN
jgi:hypothetical protein